MDRFLCIHGHFYQPPRENPWTEEIEHQESAYPFHDWNERICAECYGPNAYARILDSRGKILDIVNNYESISFNFGPTLMRWMEQKAPEVYEAIIAADRLSVARWGHGNALAQAYNHLILPLASPQDQETQILWGIEDFRFRFGRDPEAMWLPETAVNYPTLQCLNRHGMKFVILSPTQAEQVRMMGSDEWHDVSDGSIDPRRPYRCFLPETDGTVLHDRYIDVFFYDRMLAADVSFGHLLVDGEAFARRLLEAAGEQNGEPRLVNIAADGETFGHHRKHGEMALAYALRAATKRPGLELINYAAFLERHPPRWEVRIKQGPGGEGTAWSCSHGLGRWKENCGCRVTEHPEWNQKWRAPLREAIDGLRDALALLFEREGKRYFKDPFSARNAYIRVLLKRSAEQIEHFFQEEGLQDLLLSDRVGALMLLEMQRHALLMQTSCGWFFNELSGLEATAIMKHADRALQLAESFTSDDLETRFVDKLAQARSNIEGFGTGRDIFYRLVRPCRVSMRKVLNHALITDAFYNRDLEHRTIYCYDVDMEERCRQVFDSVEIRAGRASVTSQVTGERHEFIYALEWRGDGACRSVIRRVIEGMDACGMIRRFLERCIAAHGRLFQVMQEFFGDEHFTIRDMFQEERQHILSRMLGTQLDTFTDIFARIYDDTRNAVETAIAQGFVAPWEFRKAAENTLSKRLISALERLREGVHDSEDREEIRSMLQEAHRYGYRLELTPFLTMIQEILREQFSQICEEFSGMHCRELEDVVAFVRAARIGEISDFLEFINSLPIKVDKTVSQNIFYGVLRARLPELRRQSEEGSPGAHELISIIRQLAEKLDFSPDCTAGNMEGA